MKTLTLLIFLMGCIQAISCAENKHATPEFTYGTRVTVTGFYAPCVAFTISFADTNNTYVIRLVCDVESGGWRSTDSAIEIRYRAEELSKYKGASKWLVNEVNEGA